MSLAIIPAAIPNPIASTFTENPSAVRPTPGPCSAGAWINPPSIVTAVKQRLFAASCDHQSLISRDILFSSFFFLFLFMQGRVPLGISLFRAPNFVYIEESPIPNRCLLRDIRRIVRCACRATDPGRPSIPMPSGGLCPSLRANPDVRPNYLPCKYEVCFKAMAVVLHHYLQFITATEVAGWPSDTP